MVFADNFDIVLFPLFIDPCPPYKAPGTRIFIFTIQKSPYCNSWNTHDLSFPGLTALVSLIGSLDTLNSCFLSKEPFLCIIPSVYHTMHFSCHWNTFSFVLHCGSYWQGFD